MKCCSPIQVLIHPVLSKALQGIISLSGFCVTFQSFYTDINTHTHTHTEFLLGTVRKNLFMPL